MIGNLWEWTNEWYAGTTGDRTRDGCGGVGVMCTAWPPDYGGDGTWNVAGGVYNVPGAGAIRNAALPAAALRGGSWSAGSLPGRFALSLESSPAWWYLDTGFRCVIPR